jgi:hypothetical protein
MVMIRMVKKVVVIQMNVTVLLKAQKVDVSLHVVNLATSMVTVVLMF